MKCTKVGRGSSRMNVALLKEVEGFKYLGSKNTVDEGIETEVKSRINDVEKVLRNEKCIELQ